MYYVIEYYVIPTKLKTHSRRRLYIKPYSTCLSIEQLKTISVKHVDSKIKILRWIIVNTFKEQTNIENIRIS